jgi:hypothetical protein
VRVQNRIRLRRRPCKSQRPRPAFLPRTPLRAAAPAFFAGLLLALTAGRAAADVAVIQLPRGTAVDTYLKSGSDQTKNYGVDNRLIVSDESRKHRTLLFFDLSGFDSTVVVNSAFLDLYLTNQGGPGASWANVAAFGMERAWREGTGDGVATSDGATWVEADGGVPWTLPGGDHALVSTSVTIVPEVTSAWYSWDIKPLVVDWIKDPAKNLGVMLRLLTEINGENIMREFVSNDDSDDLHVPRLTINYTPQAPAYPAADSAYAEIVPRTVDEGATKDFVYSIRTVADSTKTTGVNYVQIPLASGFRLDAVTGVLVDGVVASVTNGSDSTTIRIGLTTKRSGPHRIDVAFSAKAPPVSDTTAAVFRSSVDDVASPAPPTSCVEGSANLVAGDGNRWDVLVTPVAPPGPSALRISPDSATVSADGGLDFDAVVVDSLEIASPVEPVWSVVGGIGTIDSSGKFDAVTAGAGFVVASFAALVDSAPVTVVPGAPFSLDLVPDSAEVSADSTLLFAVIVKDEDGNLTSMSPKWSVSGGIGTVAGGLFTATTAGTGWVRAGSALVIEEIPDTLAAQDTILPAPTLADSSRVRVVPGAASSLVVTPGPLTITADTTLQFVAIALDGDGNVTTAGSLSWSGGESIGSIDSLSGHFDPTTPGTDRVHVASSLGPEANSADVTVVPGALARLDLTPGAATVRRGTTQAFAAAATDLDGNDVQAAIAWAAEGGIGVVDSAGLFSADSIGSGRVIASSGAHADTASVTVPDPGSPRLVSVRSAQDVVTEGQQGLPLAVRYRNETTETLSGFTVDVRPRAPGGGSLDGAVVVLDAPPAPPLAPGAEDTLVITVGLAPSLAGGTQVVLDADLHATDVFGYAYDDAGADSTDAWTVDPAARLLDSQNSVWPRRVTRGDQSVSFLIGGMNAGGVAVTLDPAATRLRFSDGTATFDAPLLAAVSLPPDSSVEALDFAAAPVPDSLDAGAYPLTLILAGTDENGAAYAETLATGQRNQVTVLPPYVTVTPVAVSGGTVRPAETAIPLLAFDLQNGYADTRTLKSVSIANATAGPGTTTQKDAEMSRVGLYWDRNADGLVGAGDSLLAAKALSGGRATFGSLTVGIASETTARLLAAVDVSLSARDGDSLDLRIDSAADLVFSAPTSIDGSFPMNPTGRLVVDGSVAAQFTAVAIAPHPVAAGDTAVTALDVTLPLNGYAADTLRALSIAQRGTARAGNEITRVRLVRRSGAINIPLGNMVWTGARWVITGLATAIPSTGLRIAALVDVEVTALNGLTIDLAIPGGENAVSVASGNDGPLNATVSSGALLTITTSDVVLLLPTALPTESLFQGMDDVPLLAFRLGNRYATPRRLVGLRLTGKGDLLDPSRLDDLLEAVVLRVDVDGDGAPDGTDRVLGSAPLANGSVFFNNLGETIAAGQTIDFLVTGFVAGAARDGDLFDLAISIDTDVTLDPFSKVEGNFPTASTALLPVEGMTRVTIADRPAPPRTLPPGESDVLVFEALIPANGYEADVLESIELENAGTATGGADIAALHLYRDGGDGAFGAGGGDDVAIGNLPFVGSGWFLDALSVPLPSAGTRLFVSADIGATPADSATIAMRIPPLGLTVGTDNDGPIDLPVTNLFAQTISTSPLLVDVAAARSTASVGQTLDLRMNARNIAPAGPGAVTIAGIVPTLVGPSGSGSVAIVSGPAPDSLVLAPGDSGTFVWTLQADAPGAVTFTGSARGRDAAADSVTISSTPIVSPPLTIVNPPTEVALFPTILSPAAVARGATDFVPMSLTFSTSGAPPTGSAEVWSLTLALDDGSGNPVAASDLLDRVVLREAGNVFHVEDSLAASGTLALLLATPISVSPLDPVTVALALDIRSDTQVPSFRVRLMDSTAVGARDANSGATLPLRLESGAFPVATGTMLVTEPGALQVEAADLLGAGAAVNRGQVDVDAVQLLFHSVGDSGISGDVRITEVQFVVEDSSGAAAEPLLFSGATFSNNQTVFADVASPVLEGGVLRVPLATPLLLPVNSQIAARLAVSISPATAQRHLRLSVDAAHVPAARDVVTGAPIGVTLLADFQGAIVAIAAPAQVVEAAPRAVADRSVYPGTAGVAVLRARLRHPGAPDEAPARLDSLAFRVTDEIGNPIAASLRLQSVSVVLGAATIGSVNVSEVASPAAAVPIASPPVLTPGDSAVIELRAAVRGAAPAGKVRLWIDAGGLVVTDVNQGTVVPVGADETPYPFGAALVTVLSPPTDPIASFLDLAPATVGRGAAAVPLAEIALVNPGGPEAGVVDVQAILFDCQDRAGAPIAPGGLLAAARARAGSVVLATGGPADPTRLVFSPPRSIAPGETLALAVETDLLASPAAAAFRAVLADSGILFSPPGGGLPTPRARAAAGQSFPFATAYVGIAETDFAKSASNYPNPFSAGREETHFVFYLPEAGEVDIDLFSPLGEPVATVVHAEPRGPGMIAPITWDGRNGDGELVLSGVYLARIQVRYASGQGASLLRKVAVLR